MISKPHPIQMIRVNLLCLMHCSPPLLLFAKCAGFGTARGACPSGRPCSGGRCGVEGRHVIGWFVAGVVGAGCLIWSPFPSTRPERGEGRARVSMCVRTTAEGSAGGAARVDYVTWNGAKTCASILHYGWGGRKGEREGG